MPNRSTHDAQAKDGQERPKVKRPKPIALPFEDSRRLTGPNLYFTDAGAVLEVLGAAANDARLIAAWRERVVLMRKALGWPEGAMVVRLHATGAALAFAAPVDQLFTATEVNEWAWLSSVGESYFFAPGYPAVWDEAAALTTLRLYSAAEAHPRLRALLATAEQKQLPYLLDDDRLSLGLGTGSLIFTLANLPAPDDVPWAELHGIPTALVTGSNGKTTTVRLLAAMLSTAGLRTAHSCTDGVFFAGTALVSGDYSGPAGARTVLRHKQVEAAILETARGGLLRRGLAVTHADAAIVTNISKDHFGEYGIHDLAGLAETKLIVARVLDEHGVLVLNGDDAQLCAHAAAMTQRIAWFALDDAHPRLQAHRESGGTTCGVAHGQLLLSHGPQRCDLGAIEAMPLSLGGVARYNIANIAGAVLLADALGIASEIIRTVIHAFGSNRSDNPGRLEQWSFGGITAWMDYAHNPEGLRGLLDIALAQRGQGRLGLILGQAGNRGDTEIRELAGVAADAKPDLIVLKDMDGYLRGRAAGEVAQLLREELLSRGLSADTLPIHLRELDAARAALAWARPGDVLVLPVHAASAKTQVADLLNRLQASNWQAGDPLPNS